MKKYAWVSTQCRISLVLRESGTEKRQGLERFIEVPYQRKEDLRQKKLISDEKMIKKGKISV